MKRCTVISVLTVFFAVALANTARAQATNFAMVGLTGNDTLQLNLVAYPPTPSSQPQPCTATLGFQDHNGDPLGPSWAGTLAVGDSASISLSGEFVSIAGEERAEVLPTVSFEGDRPLSPACIASVEVVDNAVGTTVVIPGSVAYPREPVFGMLDVALGQSARLNVVAISDVSCRAELSFADNKGNTIGGALEVDSSDGHATSLDLTGSSAFPGSLVHPIVTLAKGAPAACIVSVEVYNTSTFETSSYLPPLTRDRLGPK